ncbi:sulfatase [Aeoliella sp.]|uniref:sulfatase n=1 Tax=Aeoliella sp. TaxID=2795800 RepID=UPI003CCC41CE
MSRWLLAALLLSIPGSLAANERMNVLFIISDDLRTEMGCYGSKLAHTPNLDALATDGVLFERAYCQFPLCNPSRTSVLTGLRPLTTGVLGNRHWFGAMYPKAVSLPRYFRDHGYVTLRAGKIFHGGIDDANAWTDGGRERYFGEGATAEVPQRDRRDGIASGSGGRALTKAERSDRWIVLEGDGENDGDYRVATRAIELLKQNKDKPFFLGCGFSNPHSPLVAPQRFFELFELDAIPLPIDFAPRPTVPDGFPAGAIRPKNADLFIGRDATPDAAREMIRAYLASTAWMDWNAGRVLKALEELGLKQRTIVVFWGDHGYQLGEKGKWSKAGSLWEQGTRVPLVIFDPRVRGNGQSCPRVVESLDIYPTLVDVCGLPATDRVEGRTLAPLLADPSRKWNHPAYTIWSEDGKTASGVSVRTEQWHFAEFFGRGAGQMLTDPSNDPHELHNLANTPENAEVVAELSQLAHEYVGR